MSLRTQVPRVLIACLLLGCTAFDASGSVFRIRRRGLRQAGVITSRKRLHINNLIAQPGTVELDWASQYSWTTATFTGPAALKFTPEGDSVLLGRTEYSVAFDSVESDIDDGGRATHFSDRVTVAATSVIFDSPHFDIAVAPQVTAFLREESGARLGAIAIARYDGRIGTASLTGGWTAATTSSDNNPAGLWDFGGGYGRRLGNSSFARRLSPHATCLWEKATGFRRTISVFGGVEYQMTERLAFDVSGQRIGLSGGPPDRQVVVGLTANFGRLQ